MFHVCARQEPAPHQEAPAPRALLGSWCDAQHCPPFLLTRGSVHVGRAPACGPAELTRIPPRPCVTGAVTCEREASTRPLSALTGWCRAGHSSPWRGGRGRSGQVSSPSPWQRPGCVLHFVRELRSEGGGHNSAGTGGRFSFLGALPVIQPRTRSTSAPGSAARRSGEHRGSDGLPPSGRRGRAAPVCSSSVVRPRRVNATQTVQRPGEPRATGSVRNIVQGRGGGVVAPSLWEQFWGLRPPCSWQAELEAFWAGGGGASALPRVTWSAFPSSLSCYPSS